MGQSDTTIQLNEIEVTAQRLDLTDIGKHTDHIDSQDMAVQHDDHLAAMLTSHTSLYVRSYGNGTLATLGIRGGNATHTQLIWNGIPLRNPMIGLVDLALIPAAFIDDASIHYGGHGAAFGSGAVGGLISMNNNVISAVNNMSLEFGIGSWGYESGSVKVNYGSKNIRFGTRIFLQSMENNFRYRLAKDQPERNQVHHELYNAGLLQEIDLRIGNYQNVTGRVWIQETDRQIPPTSTQNTSQSAQQDKSIRASLQWNYHKEKLGLQLKTAWLDEIIDYQDTLILLYTHNQFNTWLAEAEGSFYLTPQLQWAGGIYTEASRAYSANYLEPIDRNQTAFYSTLRWTLDQVLLRLQAREEVTQASWSPFLIDISAEWAFLKSLSLKGSISRNYRIPTLNDLYWRPGGNAELKPEDGWTFEGGLYYGASPRGLTVTSSITAYTRSIDNWIMWMPPVKDLRNFWAPINVARVESRGIETRGNLQYSDERVKFSAGLGIDLTWSTFETQLQEFGIEPGDQLFYVPVENIWSGFQAGYGGLTVHYDHHWFGSAPGINDALKASEFGSGGVSYGWGGAKVKSLFFLQAENVWNVPYRIIERRPMPGRTFRGGVKFTFS